MATKYGSKFNSRFQVKPAALAEVNAYGGRVRAMYDEYELPGAVLAAGDKVKVGRLPKGARVIDAKMAFDDMGTTGVFDLGYQYVKSNGENDSSLTSDDNAFLDAVDVNTAAGMASMESEGNIVGFGKEMEGDADVEITVDTASTATTGKIRTLVLYVLD